MVSDEKGGLDSICIRLFFFLYGTWARESWCIVVLPLFVDGVLPIQYIEIIFETKLGRHNSVTLI